MKVFLKVVGSFVCCKSCNMMQDIADMSTSCLYLLNVGALRAWNRRLTELKLLHTTTGNVLV